MNSAPACIILEQLGARGVELGGGRGGGEEEGESRKQQPYQCCVKEALSEMRQAHTKKAHIYYICGHRWLLIRKGLNQISLECDSEGEDDRADVLGC